jgi:hypothetical protein
MAELIAILTAGSIGIGVPTVLMWLLKIKPSRGASDGGFIEGYIIGSLTNHSD